jgi:hypothetical protein
MPPLSSTDSLIPKTDIKKKSTDNKKKKQEVILATD